MPVAFNTNLFRGAMFPNRNILWLSDTLLPLFLFGMAHLVACFDRPAIKLEDIISRDYDSFQTPRSNEHQPVNVSIQIEILNIRSVDVREMSFIADIFLYKTWRDPRLKYPAKKVEQVALNPAWREYLWTPDVYFHNAVEGTVQKTIIPYVYLWLKNDSTVVFGARLSLRLSCDMGLENFPHDTQTCDIIVKSLTHTLPEMNLQWNENDSISVGDFIILPQFEMSPPGISCCEDYHLMGKHGKFACLRGVITLTRRSGYYVIHVYIPTILLVFLSMLTFWIPVDAVPGRVTLGVTTLLTIITLQYQASLPSVSYVVALNVWLSVCIGFVFCSLMEYAAVVALLNHQLRLKSETGKGSTSGRETDREEGTFSRIKASVFAHLEKAKVLNIDRICRILFPLVFSLHCLVYWTYIVSRSEGDGSDSKRACVQK